MKIIKHSLFLFEKIQKPHLHLHLHTQKKKGNKNLKNAPKENALTTIYSSEMVTLFNENKGQKR